jgi:hypothetical protein
MFSGKSQTMFCIAITVLARSFATIVTKSCTSTGAVATIIVEPIIAINITIVFLVNQIYEKKIEMLQGFLKNFKTPLANLPECLNPLW